ncbi:MAG: type II toxin-antitoxin system PemK/MazF family toxin [Defluviitaleaceae bacterium]|nr:type II toxin-antitoxin system PemK/MazF family toxin [Defluviitaleaceae bacterium]
MDFNPTKGREQKGLRPALVISNAEYYRMTKLIIVCPISNTENTFPLDLKLDARTKTTGVILCQHIRTVDPEVRTVSFIERLPTDILKNVLNRTGLFFIHK